MSSHSTLKIGDFEIEWCKNDIDPAIMMLFVRTDKRTSPISLEEWTSAGGDAEHWSDDRCEVTYSCAVSHMRDRLELRGYTYEVAKESFRIGVHHQIGVLRESLQSSKGLLAAFPSDPDPHYLWVKQREQRTLEILEVLSPEAWVNGVRATREYPADRLVDFGDVPELKPEEQYVLASSFGRYHQFGFPGADILCMLRLVLDAFSNDDRVTYDLTDLVMGDCFDSDSDMIEYAEYILSREYDQTRTTVVLTEGSTDRWILERSAKLICPHLAPFFSFMDFDGVRLEGGAGSLANMVKAFAGAGILNRVVALFDNDTAGNSALQSVRSLRLPWNIKVLTLPLIEIAKTYPTLGPAGVSVMDINGLACAIELYLGSDCLTGSDGNLVPVQWKGYDSKLRRYQGELLAKSEVLERFRAKLATCEAEPSRLDEFDWSGLREVIDLLRSAFHQDDKIAHLEYERWSASERSTRIS